MAKDILYKNCRFEIPQIAPKGSKAGVNACNMLQLEYSGAESIKFEDCILNGGGYSIYAHSISKKYPLKNIEFKIFRSEVQKHTEAYIRMCHLL